MDLNLPIQVSGNALLSSLTPSLTPNYLFPFFLSTFYCAACLRGTTEISVLFRQEVINKPPKTDQLRWTADCRILGTED